MALKVIQAFQDDDGNIWESESKYQDYLEKQKAKEEAKRFDKVLNDTIFMAYPKISNNDGAAQRLKRFLSAASFEELTELHRFFNTLYTRHIQNQVL